MGQTWTGLAIAIFLVALGALPIGDRLAFQAFLTTSAVLGFAGGLLWSASTGVKLVARAAEASAFVMALWILTPLFLIVPFLLLAPGLSYLEAVFEAYSALTTTGAILIAPENIPDTLIFWRCLLGFLGGYLTLLTAAGILAAFDRAGLELRKSYLLTADRDNIFSNLHVAAWRIGILYSGFAAVTCLLLMAMSVPAFEAICLGLSAISTSGYEVSSGPLNHLLGNWAIAILALACFLGATNIAFIRAIVVERELPAETDVLAMILMVLGLAVLFLIGTGGQTGPLTLIADSVFIVSTSGYTVDNAAGHVPLAAVLAAIIGGAATSTAGGLKISRLVILSKSALVELARMAHPSGVVSVKHRGRTADNTAMLALWATVLGYIGLIAIAVVAFALAGEPFEAAWSAAATSLSNSGPLHDQLSPSHLWSDLSPVSKTITIFLMVLGRLEVLAGLAAIAALFRRF
ncbi:potassium transporter TrkG [Hyphobacterium sp. HN65]|uniref:Potassium transporter TrkG n=1 Tax=Hyphobacterium lacteum TaxID=3116575 RepID=A0ABU7LLZ9_9PROT|nr:potassium transporter TrkG [Hyphobacterium sp. HN65]MEE2524947.1 potassium transporter TrkG [Hyphobacterium sp. HN65]